MGKFSSQEIESQYNLIKMLLSEPEKYKDAIETIKKDIVYVSSFFRFPFGIIIQQLPFAKKVRYYEREMKLIFDKWNLEKIKKIIN